MPNVGGMQDNRGDATAEFIDKLVHEINRVAKVVVIALRGAATLKWI
jgi:hypothetical protein